MRRGGGKGTVQGGGENYANKKGEHNVIEQMTSRKKWAPQGKKGG